MFPSEDIYPQVVYSGDKNLPQSSQMCAKIDHLLLDKGESLYQSDFISYLATLAYSQRQRESPA